MNKSLLGLVSLVIGLALLVGASATASGDEFYKGKFIRFIVGNTPGGGYDTYTRAVARHIGKYISGNPTPVVLNMTGGGGRIAAHYIYKRAKPDGLIVGVWNSGLVLRQALGDRSIKFKADQFGWMGAPGKGSPTCAFMGFTGLKTLQDVLNSKTSVTMGGTLPGSTPGDMPVVLNLTVGTGFDVVHGYTGTRELSFAMQTRAVDGACWGWESMRVIARSMLDAEGEEKLIPFVTHGNPQDPEVKDLPQMKEIVESDKLAILNAWLEQYNFQRPFMLPPGTPNERLRILRKAFKATLEDPKFLAEAKRSKLMINYVSGEEIERFVDEILAISPETKKKLQFLVSP